MKLAVTVALLPTRKVVGFCVPLSAPLQRSNFHSVPGVGTAVSVTTLFFA